MIMIDIGPHLVTALQFMTFFICVSCVAGRLFK